MEEKELDRRIYKKEGEELQQYLMFRRRGSKVESKKKYNRQKFKKEETQRARLPSMFFARAPIKKFLKRY